MPVVDFSDLFEHAHSSGYRLALAHAPVLPIAKGIIESAAGRDAPVVLAVRGDRLEDGLLPSLEALARQSRIPVCIVGTAIENTEQARLAIRLGCNGLVPGTELDESLHAALMRLADDCGIPVVDAAGQTDTLAVVDDALEIGVLKALDSKPASLREIDACITRTACGHMQAVLDEAGASGRGTDALRACRPWRPVEHLIIYNTTADDETSERLAAEGLRVLDRIPGVRATWNGRAVRAEAGYRWCWLVRFAHPAVIDSYREHPEHVAYANNHFRPVAGDRISIDYTLTGADEG